MEKASPPLSLAHLYSTGERGREARKEAAMVQEAYMEENIRPKKKRKKTKKRMESYFLAGKEAAIVQEANRKEILDQIRNKQKRREGAGAR